MKVSCVHLFGLLLLFPSSAAARAEDMGAIAGVIRFTGAVPAPREIMTTDAVTIRHTDLVVEPNSKGLRDVVVIVEDAPAQPRAKDAEPVLVDQRQMIFIPRVVAVRHGQLVRFENNDGSNHSVLAVSTNRANQLNTIAAPGRPVEHRFEAQKLPVPIGCVLHPWMRAWVYVVPHPWFAVSDEQGRFKITGVPAGEYTVALHHADTGLCARCKVKVAAGNTRELNIVWKEVGAK